MSARSQDSTAPTNSTPPKFGIIHLMSYTAAAAILFGLVEYQYDILRQMADGAVSVMDTTASRVLGGFFSLTRAFGLAAIFWLLDWRRRKGRFVLQPGHWLLIGSGLNTLVTSLAELVLFSHIDFDQIVNSRWAMVVFGAVGPMALVLVLSVAFQKSHGPWKWFFGVTALKFLFDLISVLFVALSLFLTVFNSFYMIHVGMIVCATLAFGSAIIADFMKKNRRDWIHYCGLWMVLMLAISTVASMTYYRYFFNSIT